MCDSQFQINKYPISVSNKESDEKSNLKFIEFYCADLTCFSWYCVNNHQKPRNVCDRGIWWTTYSTWALQTPLCYVQWTKWAVTMKNISGQ